MLRFFLLRRLLLAGCNSLIDVFFLLKKIQVFCRKPSNSKPHCKAANDMGWEAIQELRERDGAVGLNHFKLIRRLGCGDIGSVYLCELRGTSCYFAMKVTHTNEQTLEQSPATNYFAGASLLLVSFPLPGVAVGFRV